MRCREGRGLSFRRVAYDGFEVLVSALVGLPIGVAEVLVDGVDVELFEQLDMRELRFCWGGHGGMGCGIDRDIGDCIDELGIGVCGDFLERLLMRRNDQATDEGIGWPRSEPPSLGTLLSHGRDALAELTEGPDSAL